MAEVTFRMEFDSSGFQQILNSGGTRKALLDYADGVVARSRGMAHRRMFAATMFKFGARPAVSVWTHAQSRMEAALARRVLGAAL